MLEMHYNLQIYFCECVSSLSQPYLNTPQHISMWINHSKWYIYGVCYFIGAPRLAGVLLTGVILKKVSRDTTQQCDDVIMEKFQSIY